MRISDELAGFADKAAGLTHRSPPQQIEHWAQIGRILEPALSFRAEEAVKQVGRADLDAALDQVESPDAVRRTQSLIRRTSGHIASADA